MVIAYFQWQKDEEWFAVLAIFICILFLSLICYQRKFEKNKTIEIDKKGKFDTLSDDIFIDAMDRRILQIDPDRHKIHEVKYPRHFKHEPNLKVECIKGKTIIRIIKEQNNGFKFRISESTPIKGQVKLRWVAIGDLNDKE